MSGTRFRAVPIILALLSSLIVYIVNRHSLKDACELHKCPYCYGTRLCEDFKRNFIGLKHGSVSDLIMNYASVKNVFYGVYKDKNIVLKKLGHDFELENVDGGICVGNNVKVGCSLGDLYDAQNYTEKIIGFLGASTTNTNTFRICSEFAREMFMADLWELNRSNALSQNVFLKNVWTILQLNAEPLLLQLLNSDDYWPVPHYYGACGRIIVEEHCGDSINNYQHADWIQRAYLSLQLLEAAKNFTFKHPELRFYLTDISPDNIVVRNMRIAFIDLEDVIITAKVHTGKTIHRSNNSLAKDSNSFAYSAEEICENGLSDHNFYATCKLLLSASAPWPMMENGLLHSPPDFVKSEFAQLFKLIEDCIHAPAQTNRFDVAFKLIHMLKDILQKM